MRPFTMGCRACGHTIQGGVLGLCIVSSIVWSRYSRKRIKPPAWPLLDHNRWSCHRGIIVGESSCSITAHLRSLLHCWAFSPRLFQDQRLTVFSLDFILVSRMNNLLSSHHNTLGTSCGHQPYLDEWPIWTDSHPQYEERTPSWANHIPEEWTRSSFSQPVPLLEAFAIISDVSRFAEKVEFVKETLIWTYFWK